MKKLLFSLLILCLCAALFACGDNSKVTTAITTTEPIYTEYTEDTDTTTEPVQVIERDPYGLAKLLSTESDEKFDYEIYERGAVIVGYHGTDSEVTVPATYNGNPIKAIGNRAFRNNETIKKVSIPEGYEIIGNSAFYRCLNLASVTIPDSMMSIGDGAFKFSLITNVVIPDKVEKLGSSIFYGCEKLESCTLPTGITEIPYGLFYGCTSLKLDIPSTVTSIGDYAFYYCTSLDSITIPDSVTEIGNYVFYYCSGVTSLSISSQVTKIGEYAFYGCEGLSTISIPNGVTSLGAYSFAQLKGISSIIIPSSVTTVGSGAFHGCDKITEITFPEQVLDIPSYVCYLCTNLKTINFNGNITAIRNGAFGKTGISTFVFPESCMNTGTSLFYNCKNLTSVTFNSKIVNLFESTFEGCDSLVTFTIPAGIKTIGLKCFANCPNLEKVEFAEGTQIQQISEKCFYNCPKLKTMTFPQTLLRYGVNSIGFIAGELEEGQEEADPVLMEDYVVVGYIGGALESYCKTHHFQTKNFDIIGYEGCTPYASFEYHLGENGLVIDKFIGDETEVVLPVYIRMDGFKEVDRRIVEIGEGAFRGTDIVSVNIPEKCVTIGANAFRDCTKLEVCDMSAATVLTTIGEDAFLNTGIYTYSLPKSIETIEDHAIGFAYDGENYTVLTDNEIVTVTETEKTVTITDDDGNSVTSIVIETKETVKKVSLSVSAYAGAGINYCKANKISYKTLTDTTT